jgi:hypothetical protein
VRDVIAIPDRLVDAVAEAQARMFCTVSLPRKWSMRKTCDSSKTAWTVSFNERAEPRSVPNGFSMITRARSASPVRLSVPTMPRLAAGGTER